MKKLQIDEKKTGQNIKVLIKKSDYTIEEIAEMLNLNSPRAIYAWMRGEKMPSLTNLVNLASIFSKSIEEILVIEPLVH